MNTEQRMWNDSQVFTRSINIGNSSPLSTNQTLVGTPNGDNLLGGSGNDSLYGLGGNDNLDGGSGDDYLEGGSGSDNINGGSGYDTAGFSGLSTSYTIQRNGSAGSVSGPDGLDLFAGIEALKFADKTIYFLPPAPPTELRGSKWHDLNGNGVRDAGEPGLSGGTIYIDTNNNAQLDAGERSTTTDANGSFVLTNVGTGIHKLREVLPNSWVQSAPTSGFYNVSLINGGVKTGLDFSSYQAGETKGSKWNDQNGNGTWDKGEPGLADTKIFLDQNQNGQFDVGERSTITDANGNYLFNNLSPGTYYVAEEISKGWKQTYPGVGGVSSPQSLEAILASVTTTDSTVPIYKYGEVVPILEDTNIVPLTNVSSSLINVDKFRADPRFSGVNGKGFSTVVLDSGIDSDHPFFGPDNNKDGIADRIVYQYDFADGDANASDIDGHGSNVSSIIASSDSTYTGMAPEANIIALKVFKDSGQGNFSYVEKALKWTIDNAATYNIASVNLSLGDPGNYNTPQTLYGIDDELKALAAMGVIVVSASGNDFFRFNSVPGVSYPAADPNSLSIGAVFDSNSGRMAWKGGAIAYTSGSDRIVPFSQRHPSLTTVYAPGAPITGAGANGDLVTQTGTSQAAPHIAGIAVLAQQLALQKLGRRLTVSGFENLLTTTGVTINDGDDEDDNVTNTGLNFKRVDVKALGEAILKMADEGTVGVHKVTVSSGQIVEGINFGNTQVNSSQNWGFETGNFKDWKTIGNATIQTATFGTNPTEGKYQALITTGSGSVSDAQLENVLGLTNGKLDSLLNGNATEGSAIQLATITAKKGDVLTLDYNFMTNESSPSNYKDSAFLTISSNQVSKLADTNSNLSRSTNSFGLQTGYNTFTYQFDRDGTYTVGIGVVDAEDTAVDSALLVDNVTLEEPRKFGFEPGDITNWEAKGDVSIQTAEFGISPTEGQYQALIKTSNSSVTDAELETFLGLQTGKLDSLLNGNATQGSALKLQTITVQAGDILKFDWNFLTNELTPGSYNDFGFVAITSNSVSELADTNRNLFRSTSSFGLETGYGTFTYKFDRAGTYTVGIGAVDVGDTAVDSVLLIDNLVLA